MTMRRPLLLSLLVVLIVGLTAAPASAKKVPCVVGEKAPKCKAWTAKVKFVADGDTLRPKIKQGRRWSKKKNVRLTGIQAPELSSYSRARGRKGNCMGVEATKTLEKLVKRRKVRLVAMRKGSSTGGSRTRLRRTIQVKRGGRWIDPAMVLLEKGLALAYTNAQEWAWNGAYARIAEQAAARGVGLWNPTACGKPGPSQESPLRLKVKWDAEGTDGGKTANGEWVRIHNEGATPVPLQGWRLRDSHLRGNKMNNGYRFPANAVIPARGSIQVHVGRGSDGNGRFYWGLGQTIFDNATADRKQTGDGAYLFDPDSELRAHVQYPCRTTCSEPLDGQVAVNARYSGLEYEWITITNRSSQWVPLYEYELENVPWFHEFGQGDVLAPGSSLTVWINEEREVPVEVAGQRLMVAPVAGGLGFETTSIFKDWRMPTAGILADGGDVVVLRNPDGVPVSGACHAWGKFRCPNI